MTSRRGNERGEAPAAIGRVSGLHGGRTRLLALGALVVVSVARASAGPEPLGAAGIRFEANCGQEDAEARFRIRSRDADVWLTPTEAVLALRESAATSEAGVLRIDFPGSVAVAPEGEGPRPGVTHHLTGNDPALWVRDVPGYSRVVSREVYPGTDLLFHADSDGRLEYDFVLAPGADPGRIRIRFQGSRQAHLTQGGDLELRVGSRTVLERRPVAYQEGNDGRELVEARYVPRGRSTFGIAIGRYDRARPLVVDPVLVYSTFLGGTETEVGNGVAVDPSGSAYVTGWTSSSDFPTRGAYQTTNAGGFDAFLAKLTPSGDALVYATYLGGTRVDRGRAVAADAAGNAYLLGETDSPDFPTTPGAVQPALGGLEDAFVTGVDATGSSLLFSTFLGGAGSEDPRGIVLDVLGRFWVAGWTSSWDFPTRMPVQDRLDGQSDAFLSRFTPAGLMQASTFYGGSSWEYVGAVAVDSAGAAYLTGTTFSPDFPTTPGAYQRTPRSSETEAFAVKFAPSGGAVVWSTLLGGTEQDHGYGIAVDAGGNTYVVGDTSSLDFPTIAGAVQPVSAGEHDAFLTRIAPGGDRLLASTYLGGLDDDIALAVAVGPGDEVTVAGGTYSLDFPTSRAMQPVPGGGSDAFVTRLGSGGAPIGWSTFVGGRSEDRCYSLAIGPGGDAYAVGETWSTDFPTFAPLQPNRGGTLDAWLARIHDACLTAPGPVERLLAVKSPTAADLELRWPPLVADDYALWRTADRREVPNARTPGNPPLVEAAAGCNPLAGSSCAQPGEAADATRPLLFYQVRARCGGAEGI